MKIRWQESFCPKRIIRRKAKPHIHPEVASRGLARNPLVPSRHQGGRFLLRELLSISESTRVIDGNPANGIGKTIEESCRQRIAAALWNWWRGSASLVRNQSTAGLACLRKGRSMRLVSRFFYAPGAEETSSEAGQFLAVIELLEAYIRPYYADLRVQDSEADE